MSTEPTSEEADRDVLADVREAVACVPGESSTSSCGCEWKRVAPRTFCYHGAWVSGDVLTKFCAYHEWHDQQPTGACGAGRLSRPRSVAGEAREPYQGSREDGPARGLSAGARPLARDGEPGMRRAGKLLRDFLELVLAWRLALNLELCAWLGCAEPWDPSATRCPRCGREIPLQEGATHG